MMASSLGLFGFAMVQGPNLPSLPYDDIVVITGNFEDGVVPCNCMSVQPGGIVQISPELQKLRAGAQASGLEMVLLDVSKQPTLPGHARMLEDFGKSLKYDLMLSRGDTKTTRALKIADDEVEVRGLSSKQDTRTFDLRLHFARVGATLEENVPAKLGASRTAELPFPAKGNVLVLGIKRGPEGITTTLQAIKTTSRGEKDEAVQKMVDAYYAEQRLLQVATTGPRTAAPPTSSTQCRECHLEAYSTWKHSGHATALTTLVRIGKDVPECLSCHNKADESRTSNSVECQACHAGAQKHLISPDAFPLKASDAKEKCSTCHTPERDSAFEYLKRFSRIAHPNPKPIDP